MVMEALMSRSVAQSRLFLNRGVSVAGLLTVLALSFSTVAHAASIRIVALGASNTNGKGVGTEQAWPAVLERMLRAKGYDATVTVSATNGLTSSAILANVDSAVAPGTRVVIFDLGRANDAKRNVSPAETQANHAQIAARIRAHGAKSIRAPYQGAARQQDGRHLSAEGHAQVAARLLPMVTAALGSRR
jgi:acyl-CoA thioesterase I